ncbi:starvation-inducible DNA-binding protein [Pustulibacterium marinum]|uniref:Starvation-inducible DNA-binding protein n=1 Tax=Pustulibacterium marinum TaxID=1224947 RepID=A0A1I7GYU6_9FLAO|nr:DNA starvation/stationary phase protection protein [Pustulibacterium marinum]SFU53540.1 starvation-inducible DNA-binding protein [Pustulibacterium marinum]
MDYLKLDKEKTAKTVFEFNVLLADYHMYYQKIRNFHWNVLGHNFFDLHEQFEEMYTDAQVKIDEIAERILALEYQPVSNYTEYLEISNLKESPSDLKDVEMVKTLLEDQTTVIAQMRKTLNKADDNNDEGSIDLLGAYIRELEKTSWMLNVWLKKTTQTLEKKEMH